MHLSLCINYSATVLFCCHAVVAQDCLTANGGPVPFYFLSGIGLHNRHYTGEQLIVTSYQFQCCGSVTRWQTYVYPARNNYYNIMFQVWRPGTTVETAMSYSLVGQDVYNNILLTGNGALVNRTLPTPTVISVQPGDLVGFYMTNVEGTQVHHGVQLDQNNHMQTMYYATTNSSIDYVNLGGSVWQIDSRNAPIFSIDIGKSI